MQASVARSDTCRWWEETPWEGRGDRTADFWGDLEPGARDPAAWGRERGRVLGLGGIGSGRVAYIAVWVQQR